jgi:hypothetical protein
MAGGTILAEIACDMVGICCPLKIGGMTPRTVCIHELVVAIRVARFARCRQVLAGQRKLRGVVIKRCWLPSRRGVAGQARLAEVAGYVIRVLRALKISGVTLIAGSIRKLVIVICVARLASDRNMSPRQRKFRRAVIEAGRLPRGGRMAGGTILAEIARNMVWIAGTLIVTGVALNTV